MANLLLGTLATASPGFISSRRNYFWDLFTRFVNTPRHTGNFYSSPLSVSSRLSDLRFRSVLSLPVTGLGSPLNARSFAVHAGPVARRAGSRKRVLFVVCTRRPIPLSFPVAFADVDLPRCFATSLGPVYISASDRACIVQSSSCFALTCRSQADAYHSSTTFCLLSRISCSQTTSVIACVRVSFNSTSVLLRRTDVRSTIASWILSRSWNIWMFRRDYGKCDYGQIRAENPRGLKGGTIGSPEIMVRHGCRRGFDVSSHHFLRHARAILTAFKILFVIEFCFVGRHRRFLRLSI